jgi:heme A synthase
MGFALLIIAGLQFALGWVTVAAGERDRNTQAILAAAIRTGHQTNGALLIGACAATVTIACWMSARTRLEAARSA